MASLIQNEVIVENENIFMIENRGEIDGESENDDGMENEVSYVLPEKFSYCMEENKNILRIKEIYTKEVAEEWMKKLSSVSKITWRVSRTYPRKKQAPCVFKKQYRCQHNTRRRMDAKESHKQSKNTNCPALLTIKIWSLNFCPIIENEKWPCTVEFFAEHNHSVLTPSALRYRPLSDETTNALLELFRRGHTPATAYATYYADQMVSLGEDFQANTSDRSYFPSKQDVANLWKKDFKSNYGGRVGDDMFASLEERLSALRKAGYQCGLSRMEDSYVVSICTPLMQRAHSTSAAKEVVFVDATGNCGIQKHTVYFFVANYNGVGGIPLGCIITDSKKNCMFEEGLRMFIEDFENVFSVPPKVILTDEDFSEIKVLYQFFPQTKFLLCMYHTAKACWNWLLNKHHNIPKDTRQQLYSCFKEMVYADSTEHFKELEDTVVKSTLYEPQFVSYIEKMLIRKDMWALHCRKKYLTKEYDVNNVVEIFFRVFKDVTFEQTKSFNLMQVVDYITGSFEKRFSQGILDTVRGNLSGDTIKRLCLNSSDADEKCVQKVTDYIYYVSNESASKVYEVDIGLGVCCCPTGMKGRMCTHQLAVIKKCDVIDVPSVLSEEDTKELFWIATSQDSPHYGLEVQEDKMQNILVPEISSNIEISTECFHDEAPNTPDVEGQSEESVCETDSVPVAESTCKTDSMPVAESVYQPDSMQTAKAVFQPDSMQSAKSASEANGSSVIESVHEPASLLGVESVCRDLDAMCSRLKKCVQDDPINMIPAVKGFLQMFELKSQNSTQLISTLYTAFCGILPAKIKTQHFKSYEQDDQISGKKRLISTVYIGNPKKRAVVKGLQREPSSLSFSSEDTES